MAGMLETLPYLLFSNGIDLAASAPTYAMGYTSMMRDLNASWIDVTWGLSLYSLGFALLPLFLSPLSEDFGRQPLYVCSMVLFALMQLAVAL